MTSARDKNQVSALPLCDRQRHLAARFTSHDSLMARLDRPGPAKKVAQVGAVISGEFLLRIAPRSVVFSVRRERSWATRPRVSH